MRVLLCGESWVTHSLHVKGVDSFTTSSYVEGADQLRAALADGGADVDYLPGHLVPARFPGTAAGLLMIGGYLSFAGIEGKARYHGTPVEAALPVVISALDDRVERPDGVVPEVDTTGAGHEVLAGVPAGPWPALLGYNRLTARPEARVLARAGADPLLACQEHGAGRSAVFASDCAPHWAPPAFLDWAGYPALWTGLVRWLSRAQ